MVKILCTSLKAQVYDWSVEHLDFLLPDMFGFLAMRN
jgi:hypothetical protein